MNWDEPLDVALAEIAAGRTADDVESETLEFKRGSGRSRDDLLKEIAQAAVCFANAGGGQLVVGVDDRVGGPDAIAGTDLAVEEVRRRIWELSRPNLTVIVNRLQTRGVTLLVIRVPESPEIHSDPQGRAPERIGRECVPMDPLAQRRKREERRGIDWSAQPSDRSLDELSRLALATVRDRLARLPDDRRTMARLTDQDLLRGLGCLDRAGRLTYAGEVLFCGPAEGAPDTIVFQSRLTPGGEPSAERVRAPLVLAFERALELVRARSAPPRPVTLPDGQLLAVEDFPDLAVREAVANALLHRDYHFAEPIQVDHSPQVLVVSSPGPLVGGVTPANILTHPSKPRNPCLAHAARTLGIAEEVGRGVDRIFREMIRSGRDAPLIESLPDRVRVSLIGGPINAQVTRLIAQMPGAERDDTDTMLVLFTLRSRRSVDAPTLSPVLQKPREEVQAVLHRLAQDSPGLIEPLRSTARRTMPKYRLRADVLRVLGTAVTYNRRTADDLDRKMVLHVREYGEVTNRTIQNLLDVSLTRARDLLQDWVKRGVLVKTSAHERGPRVTYGPGAEFPQTKVRGRRAGPDGSRDPASQADLFPNSSDPDSET